MTPRCIAHFGFFLVCWLLLVALFAAGFGTAAHFIAKFW
jgi:hypothetical protein